MEETSAEKTLESLLFPLASRVKGGGDGENGFRMDAARAQDDGKPTPPGAENPPGSEKTPEPPKPDAPGPPKADKVTMEETYR